MGFCCRSERLSNDTSVSQKKSSGYVENLLPKTNVLEKQPIIAIISRHLEDLQPGTGDGFTVSTEELFLMPPGVFDCIIRSRKWKSLSCL